jgi:S1-C subfamily serine protease
VQPRPENYTFDLESILGAVVGIRSHVPEDAFTAQTLGTERAGNGVIIRRDGLILTIGYLVTEAKTIWISLNDGRVLQGHVLGYDQETGFGMVQALARTELTALTLGNSRLTKVGDSVVIGGAGGREGSVAARVVAKQEFAGYWEYVLDEAIFTAPSHPQWGGSPMIGANGELLGIGSLQLQQSSDGGRAENINMIVPIDLLKPILDDLINIGRAQRPPRPWLGLFAAELGKRVVVAGLSDHGPAKRADLRPGDIVLSIDGAEVADLAGFFRRVWSLGPAGTEIPLVVHRKGRTMEVRVTSADRSSFFKGPVLH